MTWPGQTRLDRLYGLTTASGVYCGGGLRLPFASPLPKGPRLDRPETANWLAGRSPPRPEPTVRVCVTPRERFRLPHARRAAGPSPPTTTTVTDIARVQKSCTPSHFCNVHISLSPADNHPLLSFPCQDHKLSWPQPWGQVFKLIYMSVTGKLKLLPKKCYKVI